MVSINVSPLKGSSSMAKPQKAELNEEFGVLANFPVTTWDTYAYGTTHKIKSEDGFLLGRDSNAVPLEKLIEMRRRDGQTRALLRLFVLPILSCLRDGEWIMPKGVSGGEKEVEFANNMWHLPPQAGGMTTSMTKVLRQTLLALVEGFSVFEEVYQIPQEGPLKGKVTLRKLAHRASSTVQFRVDEQGGFAGIRQKVHAPTGEQKTVDIPKEKCLFYSVQDEENPFYGVSLFESAWFHYDVKVKLYYVAHLAAQMAAVPGRVGEWPMSASQSEIRSFKTALANFAFNTAIATPAGFKVTPFSSNSGFDFIKLIDHHSHLQAKSVLLQFADSENRMTIIDNGGRDASADLFVQALESIMDEISENWSNYLMPKFINWNFNSGKYPVFRFGQLTDSSKDIVKEVFSSIVTSSVLNCTPEFMRELEEKLAGRLGLDIDYAEIRKHEEEAAKKAAEMAKAEAELAAQDGTADEGDAPPGLPEAAVESVPDPESPPVSGEPSEQMAALSNIQPDIDALVAMATELFHARPVTVVAGDEA